MIKEASEYLQNVSLYKIDNSDTYDSMIKEISKEIVNSIVYRKFTFTKEQHYNGAPEYECIKFYITMIILKKLPTLITKYFIKYYLQKVYFILREDIKLWYDTPANNERSLDNIILMLSKKLKLLFNMKLQRLEFTEPELKDVKIYGIHMMQYLDIAGEIHGNEKEFEYLKLVNRTLHLGYVLFANAQYYEIVDLIKKGIELKIYATLKRLNADVLQSDKLDSICNQIKGYLVSNEHFRFGLEDKVNKQFSNENKHVNVEDFPPCINHLLEKVKNNERLVHNENILLCSYLVKIDYSVEQIIDIYKKAINYNPKTTKYNVNYMKNKEMMPYNCQNVESYGMCHKDDICIKFNIKNPLSYRRGDKK